MTPAAERIGKEIRALPLEDLLALHASLLGAIGSQEDSQDLDPEYREEIRRRMEEISGGKTEGVDAFDALREM